MARLEKELRGKTDLTSYFVCALSIALPMGELRTFEGQVHGKLTFPPRGEKGFGYDPIFIPDGLDETFAELDPQYKHSISHRARAFEKLLHSGLFTEAM